jgi:hypothetical protein
MVVFVIVNQRALKDSGTAIFTILSLLAWVKVLETEKG